MAERTGIPQLDTLIDEFLALDPEIVDGLRLSEMRFCAEDENCQNARGHCASAAFAFDALLRQHGFDVVDEHEERHPTNHMLRDRYGVQPGRDDDERWQNLLDGRIEEPGDLHWADLYGMEDRPLPGSETDGTHQATVVAHEGRLLMIDWTAAQFGYESFPLVQLYDPRWQQWQREWSRHVDRPHLASLDGPPTAVGRRRDNAQPTPGR